MEVYFNTTFIKKKSNTMDSRSTDIWRPSDTVANTKLFKPQKKSVSKI